MPTLRLYGATVTRRSESWTTVSPMVIRPPLGCSRPAMQRMGLVLPQADWPSRTSDSPSAISRSSSFTTVLPLYCRLRFSRVIFIGLPLRHDVPIVTARLVRGIGGWNRGPACGSGDGDRGVAAGLGLVDGGGWCCAG